MTRDELLAAVPAEATIVAGLRIRRKTIFIHEDDFRRQGIACRLQFIDVLKRKNVFRVLSV